MRIYFEFLGWMLRKLSFGIPELCFAFTESYQRRWVHDFWFAFFITGISWFISSMVVFFACAIMETTKQEFFNYETYWSYTVLAFAVYNWQAGWFKEFVEERNDLIERLKR